MEQGKSKYEVAKDILSYFNIPGLAVKKFGSAKPGRKINGQETTNYIFENTDQAEKALDWYLKQYKKVLDTMNNS